MLKIYNLKEKPEFLREVTLLEMMEWAEDKNITEERLTDKMKGIKDRFDNEYFCKLILLDDKELIGFISMFEDDMDERPDLKPWYATMYVKAEYRGHGYSKILNDAILDEANRRGFEKLYLKSTLENYYEKFGAIFMEKINDEKLYYIKTRRFNENNRI